MNSRRLTGFSPAAENYGSQSLAQSSTEYRVTQRNKNGVLMSQLGLGRVKTALDRVSKYDWVEKRLHFLDVLYALITAMSGWMPMMFITRVRL
jgi:hypothetical protein